MKKDIPGFEYFKQNGNPDVVKIGFTTNLKTRSKDLQTASPTKLKDRWPPVRSTSTQDRRICKSLEPWRVRGGGRDWYYLSPQVIETIEHLQVKQAIENELPLLDYIKRETILDLVRDFFKLVERAKSVIDPRNENHIEWVNLFAKLATNKLSGHADLDVKHSKGHSSGFRQMLKIYEPAS